ncbi:coth protein-domain-containing protein [Cokeromyces recurvatus]|uniref:coth protein-domain-containing protein n=1 Tax=Cokeromyces recurvatus TaxID=90255 RepID=UPI00221EC29E|nr:coth protein-domain-containing protein [Cokeromyces recurvatus]KAI7902395.1 coth protein-domain-containing protein [Cokeromyces recurvatus]
MLLFLYPLIIGLVIQIAFVTADITYNVILNSPSTDAGVIVNNVVYALKPSPLSSILFQGEAPSNATYAYAILKKGTLDVIEREKFTRSGRSKDTLNEFYNRDWNTKKLISYDKIKTITKNFNRRSDNELHPIGEIPTIHVTAKQSDLDNIHIHYLQDINISANITYISTTFVKSFTDAKFEIGGRSSRQFTKFAYNIKLKKKSNDNLSGFKKLKLRTTVSDPSYIREYLASEMYYAANQPATRGSYVRVFLNDRAVGLFTLFEKYDDVWLANEFGAGSKDYKDGALYEGEGGTRSRRADLSYKGDDLASYEKSAYSIAETAKDLSELISFNKFINDQLEFQKTANNASISATTLEWEKQIDVEGFLVCMAFEFLHGFWDGYLHNTNNYFLYKSPEQNRFIWIPWDFDYYMGSGPVSMKKISVGDYNNYDGIQSRPLIKALLKVPEYRALFEDHLQTLIDKLYNPTYSNPVIDSIVNFIQDDVAWDKSLRHIRSGREFLPNFIENIINHNFNNQTNQNQGTPSSLSLTTAAEFLIRLNSKISHSKAINGKTRHKSLYAVKEWIRVKLANISKRTVYHPLLPIPLK